jgi:hypothetical protein
VSFLVTTSDTHAIEVEEASPLSDWPILIKSKRNNRDDFTLFLKLEEAETVARDLLRITEELRGREHSVAVDAT